jgi:hypothetical protein
VLTAAPEWLPAACADGAGAGGSALLLLSPSPLLSLLSETRRELMSIDSVGRREVLREEPADEMVPAPAAGLPPQAEVGVEADVTTPTETVLRSEGPARALPHADAKPTSSGPELVLAAAAAAGAAGLAAGTCAEPVPTSFGAAAGGIGKPGLPAGMPAQAVILAAHATLCCCHNWAVGAGGVGASAGAEVVPPWPSS